MIWNTINKYKTSSFNFETIVEILEKYGKIYNENTKVAIPYGEIVGFKKEDENIINIFFENIHIIISDLEKEKSIKIYIKMNNDDGWIIKNSDYTNPVTESLKIYVRYRAVMPDDEWYGGEKYFEGKWDKYFHNAMNRFKDRVYSFTDESKFNASYGEGIKKNTGGELFEEESKTNKEKAYKRK